MTRSPGSPWTPTIRRRCARRSPRPVDVIYYLVHAIGQPGFRERDNAAAANVAEAAKDAGVGRIVYLGGFIPDDDILSEHLAGRAEVADALTVDGGPERSGLALR